MRKESHHSKQWLCQEICNRVHIKRRNQNKDVLDKRELLYVYSYLCISEGHAQSLEKRINGLLSDLRKRERNGTT